MRSLRALLAPSPLMNVLSPCALTACLLMPCSMSSCALPAPGRAHAPLRVAPTMRVICFTAAVACWRQCQRRWWCFWHALGNGAGDAALAAAAGGWHAVAGVASFTGAADSVRYMRRSRDTVARLLSCVCPLQGRASRASTRVATTESATDAVCASGPAESRLRSSDAGAQQRTHRRSARVYASSAARTASCCESPRLEDVHSMLSACALTARCEMRRNERTPPCHNLGGSPKISFIDGTRRICRFTT